MWNLNLVKLKILIAILTGLITNVINKQFQGHLISTIFVNSKS